MYLVPEAAVRVATLGAKEAKGPHAVVDAPGLMTIDVQPHTSDSEDSLLLPEMHCQTTALPTAGAVGMVSAAKAQIDDALLRVALAFRAAACETQGPQRLQHPLIKEGSL